MDILLSQGEMCYAFVSYFPKTQDFDQCVQMDKYDQCDNYNHNSEYKLRKTGVVQY